VNDEKRPSHRLFHAFHQHLFATFFVLIDLLYRDPLSLWLLTDESFFGMHSLWIGIECQVPIPSQFILLYFVENTQLIFLPCFDFINSLSCEPTFEASANEQVLDPFLLGLVLNRHHSFFGVIFVSVVVREWAFVHFLSLGLHSHPARPASVVDGLIHDHFLEVDSLLREIWGLGRLQISGRRRHM